MLNDFLWAVRWLRHNPLFAAAVTLILALGIGANTAVFSIVDAVLLRELPYRATDRMVRIDETATKRLVSGIPAQDYVRWRDRTDLFEQTVPYVKDFVTLTGGSEPDQILALRTAGRLFPFLGVHARLGRTLSDSDDQPAAPNVAVLSDRLWRRLFQTNPGVAGRTVRVGDEAFTIVGVMPPEFDFEYSNVEMWIPLRITSATTNYIEVAGRIRQGIQLSQVQSALAIVAHQMEQEEQKPGLRITVSRWSETPDRKYELTLVFILAAVGLVLLIACADVGSLLLSRAVQRRKEIAIRAALGAGFWRVVRQLLTESFVLAAIGSAAGLTAAHFALQFLARQLAALPIMLPHLQRVALNGRVLLFNAVLCILLAVLCSLAPVLSASKTDLQGALRSGLASSGPRDSMRLFSVLIACEAAFAFLLLVGSGLMIRSLIRLEQEDHGFRPDHVLTLRVPLGTRTQPRPTGKYDSKPRQMAYYRDLLERLQRIPGIRSVAVVNNLPLSGVSTWIPRRTPDGKTMLVSTRTISSQYFDAMGIPLLAGRPFSDSDKAGSPGVAIVNEYLARQFFPNGDPVGQRLPEDSNTPGPIVVGVVRDSSQFSYDQPAKAEMYFPYQQFIFGVFMSTVVARTSSEPLSVANAFRREVWAVDPDQPIVKVATMNDIIADSIWRPRFSAWIFSVLGGLALLLTSAGVYSVVAYTTTLRAREVGIRMALGATPRNVVAVILRGTMIPLAAGLAISLGAALLLSRLLAGLLYEIRGSDPVTYVAAAILLAAIGAFASARPAWKAATGDPLKALRTE